MEGWQLQADKPKMKPLNFGNASEKERQQIKLAKL